MKKRWLLKRNGDFEGGGEREPTNTATHPRIDGLGVGRGGCLEGWEVVVVGEEREREESNESLMSSTQVGR